MLKQTIPLNRISVSYRHGQSQSAGAGASAPLPYEHLKNLQIVFKISERCNLKCDYCYFFFAGDESWKEHPVRVSQDTVEAVARFARDIAQQYGLAKINIVLHGGEPLLMHKKAFAKLCETFRAHQFPGFAFKLSVQTNAMLINPAWLELFEKFEIFTGVSLDGPQAINDLHRFDHRNKSSYQATVDGWFQLQAAAREGRIPFPGLLCVVTPEANGAQVYRHFVDDLGAQAIEFLYPNLSHKNLPDVAVLEKLNQFMLDALHEWLSDDNPAIRVRRFSGPMNVMLKDESARLSAQFKEDYRSIISVSSNGDIAAEDALWSLDSRYNRLGLNVHRHSFADVLAIPLWQELAQAASHVPAGCQGCDWWICCKGGRLVTRYAPNNGFDNPSIYCEGLQKAYLTIATSLVRGGTPLGDIKQRLRQTAHCESS